MYNSTAGYYCSIGMHSTSLWQAFPTSIQQRRALECAFVVLDSTRYALPCLPEIYRKPPKYRCLYTPDMHRCSHAMVSTLEMFHCIPVCIDFCDKCQVIAKSISTSSSRFTLLTYSVTETRKYFVRMYIPRESSSTIITVVVAVDRTITGLEVVRLTENCSSSSTSVSCVI